MMKHSANPMTAVDLVPLPRDFYLQEAPAAAPRLLGAVIVRRFEGQILAARIVETEAYREDDPASHSFRGLTARTAPMFETGGIAYVYFIYGMYDCFNVVTGPGGTGSAVLIRAVEPLEGMRTMWEHRFPGKPFDNSKLHTLTNGPGKLCRALGITRKDNGVSLIRGDLTVCVPSPSMTADSSAESAGNFKIEVGPRIGITRATERQWRFCVAGSRFVSKPVSAGGSRKTRKGS